MRVRNLKSEDLPAILELIHTDPLPMQPTCRMKDLQRALEGEASIDKGWWKALATIQTIVATVGDEVVGAASYGVSKVDGSGFLLWLHAREDREVIETLLSALLAEMQHCPRVYAFWIATPLTLGVEGLPITYRPVTHQALIDNGFIGEDDWLYMAGSVTAQAEPVAEVELAEDRWKLVLQEENERIGEAEIGLGEEGIGVLWWLWVREDRRGRGLGKRLLHQARQVLGDAGAHNVLLYVDHDNPAERDRTRAIRLYQAHGFSLVDHLWSYWKGVPLPHDG